MMRLVIPEDLSKFSNKSDLMAKPTPPSRISCFGFSNQKMRYPEPFLISRSSFGKLVSDRTVMSMFSLSNSLETRAVLRLGRFENARSRRVKTFQQHMFIF